MLRLHKNRILNPSFIQCGFKCSAGKTDESFCALVFPTSGNRNALPDPKNVDGIDGRHNLLDFRRLAGHDLIHPYTD